MDKVSQPVRDEAQRSVLRNSAGFLEPLLFNLGYDTVLRTRYFRQRQPNMLRRRHVNPGRQGSLGEDRPADQRRCPPRRRTDHGNLFGGGAPRDPIVGPDR